MRNKKTLLSFFLLTLALSSCGIQEDASQTSTGEVLKKDTGSSVTHSGVLGTTSRSIGVNSELHPNKEESGSNVFTSEKLGVSFEKTSMGLDEEANIYESGSKIILGFTNKSPVDKSTDYFIEVFSKEPNATIEEAIKKTIIQKEGKNPSKCSLMKGSQDRDDLTFPEKMNNGEVVEYYRITQTKERKNFMDHRNDLDSKSEDYMEKYFAKFDTYKNIQLNDCGPHAESYLATCTGRDSVFAYFPEQSKTKFLYLSPLYCDTPFYHNFKITKDAPSQGNKNNSSVKLETSSDGTKYKTDGKNYWNERGELLDSETTRFLVTDKEASEGTTDIKGNKIAYPAFGYFLSNHGVFEGGNYGGAFGVYKLSASKEGVRVLSRFSDIGLLNVDGKWFDRATELTGAIANSEMREAIPGWTDVNLGRTDESGKPQIQLYTDGTSVWLLGNQLPGADLKTLKSIEQKTTSDEDKLDYAYLFVDKKSCYGSVVYPGMRILVLDGCNPTKIQRVVYLADDGNHDFWPGFTDGAKYWTYEGTQMNKKEIQSIKK